uniref:RT_RNaseH_2 domain-containing protein n=1 Tax=Strongyloides venezuelensis TaxID=75913 RepID=A0A0K0FQG2_STRVS
MTLQMNESSWDNLTAMVCLNYNLSYHTVLRERPAKLFLGYVSRQPFEDGDDVSNKYDYLLERQNEIEKARRSHIPGLSIHLKDLHAVENCREKFAWTKELDESFMKAKEAVCKAMRTYRIDNSKSLMLFTDASQEKVAAALMQKAGDEEDSYVPIAFFSKLLPKRVKPLPAIVIETRAIQQAILHLSKVIDGREVIIYSDHKPLTTCKKPSENIEVEMLMEEMARRGMRICYRKGSKNELADALSRATCKSLKVSEEDRIVQTIKLWRTLYDKENNEDNSIDETIGVVNEGVVSKKIKKIPEEVKKVFQKYHDQLGHPSYERSFIMIDRELVKVGKSISRKKVRKMYREFLTQCEICARLRERRKDRERNLGRQNEIEKARRVSYEILKAL